MKIIQDIIPRSNANRPGIAMTPNWITVHLTANTSKGANAAAHARFVRNGGGQYLVSWHYTVDDGADIYQHLPTNETGRHAGDGAGNGNRRSIGIEICENSDGNFEKAVANAAEFVAKLMKDHGIPISRVVPHKHWSGKNCPRALLIRWEEFVGMIAKAGSVAAPTNVSNPQPVAPGATYKIKAGDTFFKIATAHKTTVSSLQLANPGVDPLKLAIGQTINLDVTRPATHTIKSGDTLWSIASGLGGVSVNDLKAANPGLDERKLTVGQVINVIRPASPAPTPAKTSTVTKVVNTVKTVVKSQPYKLPTTTLRRGSRGADVRLLQTALNAALFKVGAVDGVYGAQTENAVKRFQSMYADLKDDGIFGAQTRARLDAKLKEMN